MEMALRILIPPFQSQAALSTSRTTSYFSSCKPVLFHFSSRKCSFAPRSLAADDVNLITTKQAVSPSYLALKKKASDVAPELRGTSIFLIGMNNPIKTSLGKLLAESLRYYYFDSDGLVAEAAGSEAAAKAFKEADEKGFRDSETEVLKQLSSMGRLVVCVGDSAVQSSRNLALLRHGVSVWLDVPLDIVFRGLNDIGSHQSSSESSPEEFSQFTALYEKCKDGYSTADATVSVQKVAAKLGMDNCDKIATEDVALEVLKEIEKLTRVKKMMEEAARPF